MVLRPAAYALVLFVALELAVWEAFLVAARPFGTTFPVAAVAAVAGNLLMGVVGARVSGSRAGAVGPGVVWLVVALALGSSRAEGDIVMPSSTRAYLFLVLGTVAAVSAVGALSIWPGRRATPEPLPRR